MNLSSIAITAFLSSLPLAEAALKGGTRAAAAGSGSEEGRELKNKNEGDVCGGDTGNTCVPTLKARSSHTLVDCLKEEFPSAMDTNVTIVQWFNGTRADDPWTAYKLTFPQVNYEDFNKANFNAALGQPRFPAGIIYAESEDEVIKAVKCANKAGYKVSPRGRGHSYQGLSSMDGYLVIDMSLMCVPEEFVVTHFDDEPWVLGGGQKAIGSIKSGAGCTNAVMLTFTAEAFPDGIYVIGSCPTVGITGYATGGGQGDATPWVGLGIDDVLSYDIVLYDGTFVTASATSHPDLYWALRGGGSGFGVITSLETAVISTPEESSGGFTALAYKYKQSEDEAREFFKRFQDFLMPDLPLDSKKYKEKIRATSAKYGGGGSYSMDPSSFLGFTGLFLGSRVEADSVFAEAGLLDPEIFNAPASFALEFSSYADAQLFNVCTSLSVPLSAVSWIFPSFDYDNNSTDICEDLGIDSAKYCHERNVWEVNPFWDDIKDNYSGWPIRVLNCNSGHESFNEADVKDEILPALKKVAIEPQSWFNRPGTKFVAEFEPTTFLNKEVGASWFGGILVGSLDPDVLLDLAEVGVDVFHFAHGAPTLLEREETGYYNREEYTLFDIRNEEHYNNVTSILVNKVYDGDASKLTGYYNYMNPEGNPDWQNFYFGENYERLSVVKAKYDVTNGFGNPHQVEPAPLSSKAGKETLFD